MRRMESSLGRAKGSYPVLLAMHGYEYVNFGQISLIPTSVLSHRTFLDDEM